MKENSTKIADAFVNFNIINHLSRTGIAQRDSPPPMPEEEDET